MTRLHGILADRDYSYTAAEMLPLVLLAPMTLTQLAERIGRDRATVRRAVQKAKAAGQVHCCGWRREKRASGEPVAVFVWGPGDDAPRPKPLTSSQKTARWRRSKSGREWGERYNGARRVRRLFERAGVAAIDPLLAAVMGVRNVQQ